MTKDGQTSFPTRIRQLQVSADIQVTGFAHWTDPLKKLPDVNIKKIGASVKQFGAAKLSHLDFLKRSSEIDNTSFEREAISSLFNLGYVFDELECEMWMGSGSRYGKCTWIKKHRAYVSVPEPFDKYPRIFLPEYWHARFKDPTGKVHKFCLYSTQFGGVAFHKTIVYHKVRMSLME